MTSTHSLNSDRINDIANQINILEFIRQYQEPCSHRGCLWVFHCNNNRDSTGSLIVNTDKNFYKCYSCESGTNALNYLIKEQGMPYTKAAKVIEDYANIHNIKEGNISSSLRFLKGLKNKSDPVRIHSNRIYQDYSEYDKLSKAPSEMWINEGISGSVQRIYDVRTQPEYNRVLYPIYDSNGKYICAKARSTLSKDMLNKLGIPKYQYIGNPGYCDYFAGMYVSKEEIEQSGEVIIFEGIKSCMLAYQYGYHNTVSAETCCLNRSQIDLLLRMKIGNIVIAFDHDKSKDDMLKNTSILRRFANIYVVIDHNNLLQKKDSPVDEGAEVWKKLYENREVVL